jgi:hypothetical protein
MINILQSPSPLTPSNIEHIYTVSSSNSGQTNMNYIFDVYSNVQNSTLSPTKIARLKVRPNSYGTATIDAQEIIWNSVKPNVRSEQSGYTGSLSPFNSIPFNLTNGLSNGWNNNVYFEDRWHIDRYRILLGEEYTSGSTTITSVGTDPNVPASIFSYSLTTQVAAYGGSPNTINWFGAGGNIVNTAYTLGWTYQYYDPIPFTLLASGTSTGTSFSYITPAPGPNAGYQFKVIENYSGNYFIFEWSKEATTGWSLVSQSANTNSNYFSPQPVWIWPGTRKLEGSNRYSGYIGEPSSQFQPVYNSTSFIATNNRYWNYWENQFYSGSPTNNLPKKFLNAASNDYITVSQGTVLTDRVRRRKHHPDCPIVISFFNGYLSSGDDEYFNNKVRSIGVYGTTDQYTGQTSFSLVGPGSNTLVVDNPMSAITYFTYTGLTNFSKVGFYASESSSPVSYTANTQSEFIEFLNQGDSCLSDPVHIVFLNSNGSWDTYTFDVKAIETKTINRQNYSQSGIRDSLEYNQLSSQRRKTIYNQDITTVMSVSTWFLEDIDYPILESIFSSPEVYIIKYEENYYNYLLPVILRTDTLVEFKNRYGKIVNYSFDMEYTPINQQKTQG